MSAPPPDSSAPRRADLALLLPALAFAALVYGPITRCYFYADDFLNLYQIANFDLVRYLLTPNGGHLLVSRNAVFYLSHALFGNEPAYYYATALLLHLVNVALLFHFIRTLTGRRGLASFAAALWGASPLSEGTLAWYAVFGQVIGVATTLVILCRAATLAALEQWPSRRERLVWYGLALIGATSFGTGLALACALPFALWVILPRAPTRRLPPLAALPLLAPLLYFALLQAYGFISGEPAAAQAPTRAMLTDGGAIALVTARLLSVGLVRLLAGFFITAGPGADWRLVLAGAALLAAVGAALATPRERRWLAVFLGLSLACYVSIAAARAVLLLAFATDVIPLITRYHYAAQLFLSAALCALLLPLCARSALALRRAALALWYGVALAAYLLLAPPLDVHDDARLRTREALDAISSAVRAQPPASDVYITNGFFRPLPLPPSEFPGRAGLFVIFFPENTVEGRRVFFTEKRAKVLRAAAAGRRTATLLVSPAPAAAARPSSLPSGGERR